MIRTKDINEDTFALILKIQVKAKAKILKMLQDKYPEHPSTDLLMYEYLKINSELKGQNIMSDLKKFNCNFETISNVTTERQHVIVEFTNGGRMLFGPYGDWRTARQHAKKFCLRIKSKRPRQFVWL